MLTGVVSHFEFQSDIDLLIPKLDDSNYMVLVIYFKSQWNSEIV